MEDERRQQESDRDQDHCHSLGPRTIDAPALRAWTLDGQRIALELDLSIYSVQAILRAAYKLTDRCFVFLTPGEKPSALVAILAPKHPEGMAQAFVGEFANEVLDQRLRESLAQEFGPLQSLIAAQAFAEGNLLDPGRDDEDYRADPRGAGQRR